MDDSLARQRFDRRFYLVAATTFALVVLVGFGRTYYAKALFGTPPLASLLVHVHGLLMSAWVALFAAQVWLIKSRQVRLHQRLGYAGGALAVLIIVVGMVTAVRAAKYGSASAPPDIPPLQFLVVPVVDLVNFAILFGAAVAYRRRAAAHKRLMLLTAINFVPPAVARISAAPLTALGPVWFFGVPTVLALTCLVVDTRRHGQLNRVFLAGSILLIGSYFVRLMVMPTAAWMDLAVWLTSFA